MRLTSGLTIFVLPYLGQRVQGPFAICALAPWSLCCEIRQKCWLFQPTEMFHAVASINDGTQGLWWQW